MAWNPSPKVAVARDAAVKFGKPMAILLLIDPDAGTMEYASYGKTRQMCGDARRLADVAYKAIYEALDAESNVAAEIARAVEEAG